MIKWQKEPEMMAFMKEFIPGHTESEIKEAFRERFGITLTRGQIKGFKIQYGTKSGTVGGRFEKGCTSHNKGKKMPPEVYEKVKPTMFKKGNVPKNHREVGSERVSVDGYVEVKVAEPSKWKLKQRILYEQYHNVTLRKDEVVLFLDGNRLNMDKDNLIKLTRAELVRFNQDHYYCNDKDMTMVAVNIAKIKSRRNR
jgi:hypothetical protein